VDEGATGSVFFVSAFPDAVAVAGSRGELRPV